MNVKSPDIDEPAKILRLGDVSEVLTRRIILVRMLKYSVDH